MCLKTQNSNSAILRINLLLVFLLVTGNLYGQKLKLLSSFDLKEEPTTASIDRKGQLYFGYHNGDVERFSPTGEDKLTFSSNRRFTISILEAWNSLKTFVYSAPFQEYVFLDRFFNPSVTCKVESDQLNTFDGIATIENDQTLWAFNVESQKLRKVDLFNNEVVFDNQLNLTLNIDEIDPEFIRVYQNLVFISEADHGIAIFDNLGSFLDFIPIPGINFFTFFNDEIVLYDGNQLRLVDIYQKTEREIPLEGLSFKFIFMQNNQLIGITKKQVQRYEIIN